MTTTPRPSSATSTAALGALDAFEAAGTPGAFVAYVQARDATADTVAVEMQLDPATLRAAWAKADLAHQEAMLAALTQLGVAYRGYKSDPGVGFDCSGLTSWAWARAGVQIAHQSSAQISAARRVDESAAVAGDIVQYPGHVMLYLGVDRAIVHASNPSTDVELSFVPRSVRFGDPAVLERRRTRCAARLERRTSSGVDGAFGVLEAGGRSCRCGWR